MNLYEETMHLLRERPRYLSYARISRDTGLSKHWLAELLVKDSDPGVRRIQKLNDYLKGEGVKLESSD